MAFHNEYGQVTIDEASANVDIQRIRQALTKLNEAQKNITVLKASASNMEGLTGTAIVEQCVRLENQISNLNTKLNGSIKFIEKTVQRYKEEDHRLAIQYKSGGGV